MISVLFAFLKRYMVFVACGVAAFVSVAAISPRVLDFIEFRFDTALPYEAVVRLTLLAVYAVLLSCGLLWVLLRGRNRHLLIWAALAFSFIAFAVVVFGDQTHRLMEEFSWIRYTTGLFLLLAGCVGLIRFFASLRMTNEGRPRNDILLAIFGVGFLYAALDEVLELHEKLGRVIGELITLPPNATDYITIVYALIGIAVVLSLIKSAHRWVVEAPFSIIVLLAGVSTYLLSTIFDTVDFFILERLRGLGAFWTARLGSYLTDVLYIVWAPRNFLNGLEELLEQIAAALFFAALVSALAERPSRVWMDKPAAERVQKIKRWGSVICGFAIIAVAAVVLSGGRPQVPLIPGGVETIIAGAPQGLFHADDIAYHPAWGIIVANEGRGSIYQWRDSVWRQIPVPDHLIQNPDSVSADDTQIYVADSAQGIVFAYRDFLDPESPLRGVRDDRKNDGGGWIPLFTRKDGLSHPEALAVIKDTVYVLDEGEKTINKLAASAIVESWRPDHPKWVAPESIAYDAARDRLYVSDDESGAVFVVDFTARSLREIATLPRPEDITVLPDGTLLATDTRIGSIFRVYPEDGRVEKIAQFRRPYRDLQGIAYDGERVFVISSDGFGSSSFVPSFLWKLDSRFRGNDEK